MGGLPKETQIEVPVDWRVKKNGRYWDVFVCGYRIPKKITSKRAAQALGKTIADTVMPVAVQIFCDAIDKYQKEREQP